MKLWTEHHRAMLDALRADHVVGRLVERLSLGRCTARPDDARVLRGWICSLRADPGWAVLAAHLDRRRGWPEVWRRAVDAGFSARTDHHHALLFGRFCNELADQGDLEVARYCWTQCLQAWRRVADSGYLDALLAQLDAPADFERHRLLDQVIDDRVRRLHQALGIDAAGSRGQLDRRRVRFGWETLARAAQCSADGAGREDDQIEPGEIASDQSSDLLAGLADHARRAQRRAAARVVSRFDTWRQSIDLSQPDHNTISAAFGWIADVFELIPIDAATASRVTDAAVEMAWKLRKLQDDANDQQLDDLLELAHPFNDALEQWISDGSAFGHHSTCADFLVFQGEQHSSGTRRAAYFERAHAICPGHRNAAMMLSYERLRQANNLLVALQWTPSAITLVPAAVGRVESTLDATAGLIDDAESLFPTNDDIAEYRQRVVSEADRLGAEVPT